MTKMILSSLVAILLLNGCGESDDTKTSIEEVSNTEEVSNKAPIVNAGANKTVIVNETITLIGTASDGDGVIANYEWKKGRDTLSNTATLTYIPTKVGVDTLVFIGTDDDGKSSRDSIIVTVTDITEPRDSTSTVTDITEPSDSTSSESSEQNSSDSKDAIFS